jgi:hypothetical protein
MALEKTTTWESPLTRPRLRSGLTAALTVAVAVGCVQLPTFSATKPAESAALSAASADAPLVTFLATARPGDSAFITDPDSGQRASVTADPMYYAASGQYCRRYHLAGADSGAPISSGLACKNGKGEWSLHKLIANPNDVNTPQKPATPRPGSS